MKTVQTTIKQMIRQRIVFKKDFLIPFYLIPILLNTSCNLDRSNQSIPVDVLCTIVTSTEVLEYLHLDYNLNESITVYTPPETITGNYVKCNKLLPAIEVFEYTGLPSRELIKNKLYITEIKRKRNNINCTIMYYFEGVIFNLVIEARRDNSYFIINQDRTMF